MFILDSLMISGIRWALETALTAAEAEMNDDSVLREQLLEEMQSLAELQRQVLLLHDLEGYRHREVAEALNISEVSSRVHLFAARRALPSRLTGRYHHEGS